MEPLLSQRYVPFNHCPRPKVNNNQNGLILRQKTSVRPIIHIPKQPFRFMDLPVEIQRLVFELLFGRWEVTLDHERISMLRSTFHVQGVPSMNVLLTSRAVYHQARDIRMNAFNGRLRLNSVFLLVSLKRRENFRWLRDNVRILHFSDSSVHPERWNRYYDNFPNLQRLEIDFPYVLSLDARCSALDQVLAGQRDHILLETLDAFKLSMVDQLSGMVQVIVSQRYCLKESVNGWKGIVDVQIEFGQSGIRVVKRTHDGDVNVMTVSVITIGGYTFLRSGQVGNVAGILEVNIWPVDGVDKHTKKLIKRDEEQEWKIEQLSSRYSTNRVINN